MQHMLLCPTMSSAQLFAPRFVAQSGRQFIVMGVVLLDACSRLGKRRRCAMNGVWSDRGESRSYLRDIFAKPAHSRRELRRNCVVNTSLIRIRPIIYGIYAFFYFSSNKQIFTNVRKFMAFVEYAVTLPFVMLQPLKSQRAHAIQANMSHSSCRIGVQF
jgi:hypothetical protein